MLKLDINLDFESYGLNMLANLQAGETLGIYGKSGIGKSTLLKVIAGLQKSNQSTIYYDQHAWNEPSKGIHIPSKNRSVGLVFQDFALFPNLTVKQNLQYAQKISERALNELILTLDISPILNKKSNEISGGQKQRTAIGRAIAYDPQILLMDEPFVALDEEIKLSIKTFLKSYIIDKKKIAIIASHDQTDLSFFTDQIVSLREA